ncbi:MAG: hypothetical protein KIG68_01380 [Oxalobacter sp.]|nr:hypothetical protein [Oxalobacter sp.]
MKKILIAIFSLFVLIGCGSKKTFDPIQEEVKQDYLNQTRDLYKELIAKNPSLGEIEVTDIFVNGDKACIETKYSNSSYKFSSVMMKTLSPESKSGDLKYKWIGFHVVKGDILKCKQMLEQLKR